MSKIGKQPVIIPSGVKVDIKDGQITVIGPKGNLSRPIHKDINAALENDTIVVTRPSDNKKHRSLHGLTRALIQNMVTGVTDGFTITLEINGIGYRAEMKGKLPKETLIAAVEKQGKIIVGKGDTVLSPYDTMIVISKAENLQELEKLF